MLIYTIQFFQVFWWFLYTLLIDEKDLVSVRVCCFLIFLFRSLEIVTTKYCHIIEMYRIAIASLFIAQIALIEILIQEAQLFTYNKLVNVIIFLLNVHMFPFETKMHQRRLVFLLICAFVIRLLIKGIYDSTLAVIEPIILLIFGQILLFRKPELIPFSGQTELLSVRKQEAISMLNIDHNSAHSLNTYWLNIVNIFPQGMIVFNQSKNIEMMNHKCERLLEVKGQQEVMRVINEAYSNSMKDNSTVDDFLDRFFKNQQPSKLSSDQDNHSFTNQIKYKFMHQIRKQSKEFIIQIQMIPVRSEEPFVFLLMKNATQKSKVKQLQKELHFQNSLLKSFSHELRTPLNCSISMLLQAKEQSNLQCLDVALSQNLILTFQINDILDFAAFQCHSFSYQWKSFFFEEIFEELAFIYTYQCKSKDIDFIFEYGQLHKHNVINDKQRIMQVLVNLINNSLKFTKSNGKITVKLELQNELYQFQVIDNGIGIKQEKLERISQSSIKMNESFGLGINISSRIVFGLAKEKLEIKSQLGIGTKISFKFGNRSLNEDQDSVRQSTGQDLPIAYQLISSVDQSSIAVIEDENIRASQEEGNILDLPKVFEHGKHMQNKRCKCVQVLVVDDVPSNHIAISSLLNSFKLKSDSAYDGFDALQLIHAKLQSKCCTQYKLIIMDVEMPNMDGFEASAQILKLYKTNIVICSAYNNKNTVTRAQELGIKDIVTKPLPKKELAKLIQKYLQ